MEFAHAYGWDFDMTTNIEEVDLRTLVITGVTENISTELLELYFESNKHSDGGPLESIEINHGKAILVFEEIKDAVAVSKRKEHIIVGQKIYISPLSMYGKFLKPNFERTSEFEILNVQHADSESKRYKTETLNYQGLDTKKIYTSNLQMVKSETSMDQPSTSSRVCHGTGEESKNVPLQEGSEKTVIVTGFKSMTVDDIEDVYENKKRSGGGPIESIIMDHDNQRVLITFENEKDAAQVLQQRLVKLKNGNTLVGTRGQVRTGKQEAECEVHSSVLQNKDGEIDPDMLLLKHLPKNITTEDITTYLELVRPTKVKTVQFGQEAGTALVNFVNAPGYKCFVTLTNSKKLQGNVIIVEKVKHSRSIQVFGAKDFTPQKLQIYFEHSKSGGGEIGNITVFDSCAVITFSELEVAQRVLQKQCHIFDKRELHVQQYHSCIGLLPSINAKIEFPIPVNFKNLDTSVISFMMNTRNKEYVEEQINEQHGTIVWPSIMGETTEVIITCLLQRNTAIFEHKANTWRSVIENKFSEIMDDFCRGEVKDFNEEWTECLHFIDEVGFNIGRDKTLLEVDHNARSLIISGKKGDVEKVLQKLKKEIADIKFRNQQVHEHLTPVEEYQLKLLLMHQFPQKLKNVKLDKQKCIIVFTGTQREISANQQKTYDFLGQIGSEKLKLSQSKWDLLQEEKANGYVKCEFEIQNCHAVYYLSSNCHVIIYAKSQDLSMAAAVFHSCIQEHTINIENKSRSVFASAMWTTFSKKMTTDYQGEMIYKISSDTSAITVTAIDQVLHNVVDSIRKFVKDHTTQEIFIGMEKGTAELLFKEREMKLDIIVQDYTDFAVKVDVNLNDNKSGISIQGFGPGFHRAVKRIHQVCAEIVCVEHSIERYSVQVCQYFSTERGRLVLQLLQKKFKVLIYQDKQPVSSEFDVFIAMYQGDQSRNLSTTFKLYGFSTGVCNKVAQEIDSICEQESLKKRVRQSVPHIKSRYTGHPFVHATSNARVNPFTTWSSRSPGNSRRVPDFFGRTTEEIEVDDFLCAEAAASDSQCKLTCLQRGTAEYNKILNVFQQERCSIAIANLQIQKLENPTLRKKYELNKDLLSRSYQGNKRMEHMLWHGTSGNTIEEINANGFNRSFCGKNGTAYGKGVYFATSASYSIKYAKPNINGLCFMYFCRVLTGSYTTGTSDMLIPPPKDPNNPGVKFDSVVNNVSNPSIFVIFQDAHAYPEYLITFRKT